MHAEQRAQQYINANSNLNLVHHANTQTSFCDDNVLMRHMDTIPVLKSRPQDCELSKDLSGLVDRLIKIRLNSGGKKTGSDATGSDAISGREVVRQIVNSFFDNVSDLNVDVLNQTIQKADSSFQPNSFFNAANVEKILGQYSRQVQKTNGEINFEEPKREIMTLLTEWKRRLGDVSPERITNDQLLQQNARDKQKGSCQCCRIALSSGKGSAGSFIQDISGEIPGQFVQENVVFQPVVVKMVEKGFLVSRSSEDKPKDEPGKGKFVFTKEYAKRALDPESSRVLFIDSLAKDLGVQIQDLTNFFGLLIFTHLKDSLVPWPLPKGRQSRTLPLDFDKILGTAMMSPEDCSPDFDKLFQKISALLDQNKSLEKIILDIGVDDLSGLVQFIKGGSFNFQPCLSRTFSIELKDRDYEGLSVKFENGRVWLITKMDAPRELSCK